MVGTCIAVSQFNRDSLREINTKCGYPANQSNADRRSRGNEYSSHWSKNIIVILTLFYGTLTYSLQIGYGISMTLYSRRMRSGILLA